MIFGLHVLLYSKNAEADRAAIETYDGISLTPSRDLLQALQTNHLMQVLVTASPELREPSVSLDHTKVLREERSEPLTRVPRLGNGHPSRNRIVRRRKDRGPRARGRRCTRQRGQPEEYPDQYPKVGIDDEILIGA